MNSIKITAITIKGLRAINKNKKDETKLRRRISTLPERFLNESMKEFMNLVSVYKDDYNLISGEFSSEDEYRIKFIKNLKRDIFKINKSEFDIDYKIEFIEGVKNE